MRNCIKFLVFSILVGLSIIPTYSSESGEKVRLLYFSSYSSITGPDAWPSLAQYAWAIKQQKLKHKNVHFVHGGGAFGPSVMGAITGGAHMATLLNALKPDVMAAASGEFYYGYDKFIYNSSSLRFPLLSSNLLNKDTQDTIENTKLSYILSAAGLKIGFIALTSPADLQMLGAIEVAVVDERKVISSEAAKLRSQGANAIIVLADKGYQNLSTFREEGLVDVIFYRHYYDSPIAIDHQGEQHKLDTYDHQMIALDLWLEEGDAGEKVLKTDSTLMNISLDPEEPAVGGILNAYTTKLKTMMTEKLASSDVGFNTYMTELNVQENGFANLVADSILDATDADLVVINSGQIQGNFEYYQNHALTRADLQNEIPMEAITAVVSMSGKDIKKALLSGVECGKYESGCFPQLAGVRLRYDTARPVKDQIISIWVGDRMLQPERMYRVGTVATLANGEHGYTAFEQSERLSGAGTNEAVWKVVADYVARQGVIAPETEGRSIDISAMRGYGFDELEDETTTAEADMEWEEMEK